MLHVLHVPRKTVVKQLAFEAKNIGVFLPAPVSELLLVSLGDDAKPSNGDRRDRPPSRPASRELSLRRATLSTPLKKSQAYDSALKGIVAEQPQEEQDAAGSSATTDRHQRPSTAEVTMARATLSTPLSQKSEAYASAVAAVVEDERQATQSSDANDVSSAPLSTTFESEKETGGGHNGAGDTATASTSEQRSHAKLLTYDQFEKLLASVPGRKPQKKNARFTEDEQYKEVMYMDKYTSARKAILKLVRRVFKMTWKQLTLGDKNQDNEITMSELSSMLAPYCKDRDHRLFAVHTVFNLIDGQGVDKHTSLKAVDGYLTKHEWMSRVLLKDKVIFQETLKVLWAHHNGELHKPKKSSKIDALKLSVAEARSRYTVADQTLRDLRQREFEIAESLATMESNNEAEAPENAEKIAALKKERRQLRPKLKRAEQRCHSSNQAYGKVLQQLERAQWLQEFGQKLEAKRADLDSATSKLQRLQQQLVKISIDGRLEEVPAQQKRVKNQSAVVHRKTQAFRRLETKYKQARLSKGPTPGTTNTVEQRNEAIEAQIERIALKEAKKEALAAANRTWHGSPSQYRKLSYSSVANRFIRNEQEWEPVGPKEGSSSGHRWTKAGGLAEGEDGYTVERTTRAIRLLQQASAARMRKFDAFKAQTKHENRGGDVSYVLLYAFTMPEKLCLLRSVVVVVSKPDWLGSPSSNAHLSFSSVANRHIRNKQELPGYDPADNPVFDASKFSPKKAKKAPKSVRRAQEEEQRRLKELEDGFVGNPHSYHRLTFSSTVNKTFKTKQEVPEYTPKFASRTRKVSPKYDPSSIRGLQQKLRKTNSLIKRNQSDLETLETLIAESEANNESADAASRTEDSDNVAAMRKGAAALSENIQMLTEIANKCSEDIAAAKLKADKDLQGINALRRKVCTAEGKVVELADTIAEELRVGGLALHARTGFLARFVMQKLLENAPASDTPSMLFNLSTGSDFGDSVFSVQPAFLPVVARGNKRKGKRKNGTFNIRLHEDFLDVVTTLGLEYSGPREPILSCDNMRHTVQTVLPAASVGEINAFIENVKQNSDASTSSNQSQKDKGRQIDESDEDSDEYSIDDSEVALFSFAHFVQFAASVAVDPNSDVVTSAIAAAKKRGSSKSDAVAAAASVKLYVYVATPDDQDTSDSDEGTTVAAAVAKFAKVPSEFVRWFATSEAAEVLLPQPESDSGEPLKLRRLTIGITKTALRKHLAEKNDLAVDESFNSSAQLVRRWDQQLQATRSRALNLRLKLETRESAREKRLSEERELKAARAADPEGFVSEQEAKRQGWKGSPSTFYSLSYSSTTNRHIVNEQEKAILGTDTSSKWKAPPLPKPSPAEVRHEKYVEARRKGFIGSPSSYKELSFSSSANRHIYNTQSYREVEPEPDLLPKKLRAMAKKRMKREALGVVKLKRKEEAEAKKAAEEEERRRRNLVRLEKGFVGSPSSYRQLSFSSTANRHIHNSQELPRGMPEPLDPDLTDRCLSAPEGYKRFRITNNKLKVTHGNNGRQPPRSSSAASAESVSKETTKSLVESRAAAKAARQRKQELLREKRERAERKQIQSFNESARSAFRKLQAWAKEPRSTNNQATERGRRDQGAKALQTVFALCQQLQSLLITGSPIVHGKIPKAKREAKKAIASAVAAGEADIYHVPMLKLFGSPSLATGGPESDDTAQNDETASSEADLGADSTNADNDEGNNPRIDAAAATQELCQLVRDMFVKMPSFPGARLIWNIVVEICDYELAKQKLEEILRADETVQQASWWSDSEEVESGEPKVKSDDAAATSTAEPNENRGSEQSPGTNESKSKFVRHAVSSTSRQKAICDFLSSPDGRNSVFWPFFKVRTSGLACRGTFKQIHLQTVSALHVMQIRSTSKKPDGDDGEDAQSQSSSNVDIAIASGSFDGTVEIWKQLGSSKSKINHLATLTSKYEPNCVAVEALNSQVNGKKNTLVAVACVSRDGSQSNVRFFKLHSGRGVPTKAVINTKAVITCMASVGAEVVTGDADGNLRVWSNRVSNKGNGKWVCRTVIQAHSGGIVRGVVVIADGRFIASVGADSAIKVWDVRSVPAPPPAKDKAENDKTQKENKGDVSDDQKQSKRLLCCIETGANIRVLCAGAQTSAARGLVAVGLETGAMPVFQWSESTEDADQNTVKTTFELKEIERLEHDSPCTGLTFLPDSTLVSGHETGQLVLWRGAKKVTSTSVRDSGMVSCLSSTPGGRIVAGFDGGAVRLFS